MGPAPAGAHLFALACAITWGSWLPLAAASYGVGSVQRSLLYVVGGLGPGIAAVVVMRVLHGPAGDTLLSAALLRWRVSLAWWLVAVLGFVIIWAVAAVVDGNAGGELRAYESWPLLALTALRYLVQAVPEEVGWRGFALPMPQARRALVSSLVLGAGWALWHLPLLITADNVMSAYPVLPWVGYVLSASVLYGWLYNNTAGSVLIAVVFHAMSNIVGIFSSQAAVVTLVCAATVVLICGPAHLSRSGQRVVLASPARRSGRAPR